MKILRKIETYGILKLVNLLHAYYSFLSIENDIDLIESDLLSFVENNDMREVYDSIKVKFSTLKAMS